MNVFVSGGCKNGKSMFAQRLAKEMAEEKQVPLYYVATMKPVDGEDDARIERHRRERDGWGFITIEQALDICGALDGVDPKGVFLLDSVTALLSNEMFPKAGVVNKEIGEKVAADLKRFAELTGNTVFVSDYIYSEAKVFDEITEKYRQNLALCDRSLAAVCDKVYEVAYGVTKEHK